MIESSNNVPIIPKYQQLDCWSHCVPGMYECYAHNEVGTGQKKTFSLEVEFSPEVRTPLPRVSQALGYKTTLECEIEAYPPPSIIWTRDGKEITNNGSFLVSHFAKQDEKIVSTVQVS